MSKLWNIAAVGIAATGLITGGLYAHKKWEEVRAHESKVTQKALQALEPISPEDQATIDAYRAMKEKWNQKVQKATDGEMDLNDVELRILFSRINTSL